MGGYRYDIEQLKLAIGGGSLTTEQVQDIIGAAVTAGTNVTVTYNDPAGTVTIDVPNEGIDDRVAALLVAGTGITITYNDAANTLTIASSLVGVTDGDKGDITVSGTGTTWSIDNDAVTYAKMQNVSATSRVLGRKTSGSGDTEECTLSEILDFIGSAAQGDILYRGASGWARLGAGTSGQFLKTFGASANPAWGTISAGGGGGGGLDPVNRWDLFDDMDQNMGGGSTSYIWSNDISGLNAAINKIAVADHPGVAQCTTGTTSSGTARSIRGTSVSTAAQPHVVLGANDIIFESLFRVPTLPDGTQTFLVAVGMRDTFTSTAAVFGQMAWSGSAVIWQLVTRTAAGVTTTNNGVSTPLANTWHLMKLVMNSTTCTMYIDGVSQTSNNTNLPTTGLAPSISIIKTAGSTARTLDVDFVWAHQDFASPRY